MTTQLRMLKSGIGIKVHPVYGRLGRNMKFGEGYLEIDDQNMLSGFDREQRHAGFQIEFFTRQYGQDLPRIVLAQRNRESRKYLNTFKLTTGFQTSDGHTYDGWIWESIVEARRRGGQDGPYYTVYHDQNVPERTNRINVCVLLGHGRIKIWEVGIISPDGENFQIIEHLAWVGRLYQNGIGVPEQGYEAFERRKELAKFYVIENVLSTMSLAVWGGYDDEFNPVITPPSGDNEAIMVFFDPFMGGGLGQGVAILADGSEAYVRGSDIEDIEGDDTEFDLSRGTVITYEDTFKDTGDTPRLTGVIVPAKGE